jgi:hypothetical protein
MSTDETLTYILSFIIFIVTILGFRIFFRQYEKGRKEEENLGFGYRMAKAGYWVRKGVISSLLTRHEAIDWRRLEGHQPRSSFR